jgi:hypothetical protein
MPTSDHLSRSEPRWCEVCRDRPSDPGSPVCNLAQCRQAYGHSDAAKRAMGCLLLMMAMVGVVATLFGYWLRDALS